MRRDDGLYKYLWGSTMPKQVSFSLTLLVQGTIFTMKFILIATCILAVTAAIRIDPDDRNDSKAIKKHGKRGLVNLSYGHHHHQETQHSQIYGPPGDEQPPIYEVPAPAQHPPISQGYPEQIFDQHQHHHDHHHSGQFVTHPVAAALPVPQPVAVPVPHPVPVAQPVPHPVPVPVPVYHTVTKHVGIPVPVDRPYPVPVAVPVPKPYPVHVEKIVHVDRPIAVPVEKHIHVPVPVDRPYAVPVPVPRPYPVTYEKLVHVDRPYPVHVAVPVHVPKPYPVPVAIHTSHHYKTHHNHGWK